MKRKDFDEAAVFQSYNAVAKLTGLSRSYLREGVKRGEIPHIIVGSRECRINVPLFLAELEKKSRANQNAQNAAQMN